MAQYQIEAGDSLVTIASRFLGSGKYWREIADLNDISPIEEIPKGINIEIPAIESIVEAASPILSDVSAEVNRVSSKIEAIASILPPVEGYAKEAVVALGEVNGVIGEVQQVLTDIKSRNYKGGSVRLIDWLLQ